MRLFPHRPRHSPTTSKLLQDRYTRSDHTSRRTSHQFTLARTSASTATAMPPFDEETQADAKVSRSNKKSLITFGCLQVFVVSTFLAIGYVVGTAAAPSSPERSYAGGIAWIIVSLVAVGCASVSAWILWKRQQANKVNDTFTFGQGALLSEEKRPTLLQNPVMNRPNTDQENLRLDRQLKEPAEAIDDTYEQNPFDSPRSVREKQPRAETKRTVSNGSIELQLLGQGPPRAGPVSQRPHTLTLPRSGSQSLQNMIVANYIGDGNSLPRTPVTIKSQRSSIGPGNQLAGCERRVSTDPAAYFRNRSMTKDTISSSTSDETVKPNLMPPKIDSEFWRSVERSTSRQDDVPSFVHPASVVMKPSPTEPASPTPGARDSMAFHPPRQSSLPPSNSGSDTSSTALTTTPEAAERSIVDGPEWSYPGISIGNDSQRSSVILDESSMNRRSYSIVFPKRLSSLGAPTGLTTSMLSTASGNETVPHFSVPRTPSRQTSMVSLNDHDRSVSPVIALYAEMNNSSNTSLENVKYAIHENATSPDPHSAQIALSTAQIEETADHTLGNGLPQVKMRPESSTLPRPDTYPTLQFTETSSDNGPFAYDESRYRLHPLSNNDRHGIEPGSRHVEDDTITPVVRPFSNPMTPSASTMTMSTSVSSFEPSLFSSQINLRAAEVSPKRNSAGSTPTKRSSAVNLSSRKTSTDRLSFKSAKTNQTQGTENDDDDEDRDDRRSWSRVNMYRGS
ncbi:hypothetical protein EJ05DRAFT_497630 [Pseudovirgaria hyperparasitica]|uniref:Uncharacterized protein n=1 Tax=Pseudovirgaria hyperparasitica TaxID=470096 RepID=A0A6A6WG71_9PEZI|nr:uncharacterized protein EJ05DRAFT_497630 [Pseudovirgaria hyperparasitica]KAF2761064.1 hypothetical protein EJ05DRAFT_497630 [Pseudovirgaria hyperparasitica]